MSQKRLRKIKKQQEVVTSGLEMVNKLNNFSGIMNVLRENWKFLLFISLLVIGLFWNGVNGNFVSDDYATIPQNPYIKDFGKTLETTPNLVNLSNTLIAKMFGIENPFPFHFYNVLILISICILGFLFLELIVGKSLAMLAIAIFSVHPIHVEAVTWISGRPYSMFAFFTLIITISSLYFFKTQSKKYLILAILALILAYKSDGARTLGLIFIIPFSMWFSGTLKNIKINWGKLLPFSIVALTIMTAILWPAIIGRINVVNSGYNTSESIFYNPFFQYPTSITKYLQLLLVPIDLTLYHTMYTLPVWLNWFVFILYLVILIYFFFKDKRITFALAFIFVAAAASISPVKVAWLVAERYLFLGSLGFCLFMAIMIDEIGKRNKILATSLLVVILSLYSVRTFIRNNDWTTNHKLWVNTCQVSPNSHNAWNNIGDDYDKINDPTNAVKGFTQSTIVKPNYADAYHNRANILFKTGRLDLARESYSTALSFSPGLYQTYLSLTQIDLMEGKNDLALQHSEAALKLQPDNPQAAYVVGVVYAQVGKMKEAKQLFELILQKYPTYTLAADALKNIEATTK